MESLVCQFLISDHRLMIDLEFENAVNEVLQQIKDIHPNISVLSGLSSLLRNPNTDLEDLSQLIKSEASLTLDILRISNSAFYGSTVECTEIESALARLGFTDVLKIVSLILAQNLSSENLLHYQLNSDELWSESVTVSLLMEELARPANLNKSQAATAGVLHNVGRVMIDGLLEYANNNARWDTKVSVTEWEKSVVGLHYGQAGGRILKEMDFPEEIREIIRHHVDPEEANLPIEQAYLLNYCVQLAGSVGKGFTSPFADIPAVECLAPHIDISDDDVISAIDVAKSRFQEINNKVSA